MKTPTLEFLRYMKGQWFLQENYYLLKKKQQIQYKKKLNFFIDLNERENRYLGKNKKHIILNKSILEASNINSKNLHFQIESFYKNAKSSFCVEIVKEKLLKVCKLNNHRKTIYEEYIYLINQNVIISVTSLKSLNQKQCLGVRISSYIRQLNT